MTLPMETSFTVQEESWIQFGTPYSPPNPQLSRCRRSMAIASLYSIVGGVVGGLLMPSTGNPFVSLIGTQPLAETKIVGLRLTVTGIG